MPARRKLLIAGALGGLLFVAAFAFFASRTLTAVNDFRAQVNRLESIQQSGDTLLERRGAEALVEMRRLRGITIPDSAGDAYFAQQGSSPAYYWLRFTLPPADADSVFASCFETPPQSGYNPGFAYADSADIIASLDWWTPDSALTFEGAECSPQNGVRAAVLVDQSDPAHWTVYLEIESE